MNKLLLVFASSNENKVREIRKLLPENIEVRSLNDLHFTEDIPETADTFSGNASLKARFIYERFGLNCFADDSGLEIEALNNEPGVYSARYAGEPKNDLNNLNLVLRNMQGISNRKACFKTVISLILEGEEHFFEGMVSGNLCETPRGKEGFGYDPIFIPENASKTFAEMDLEEKNQYSHRARAIAKMLAFLMRNFAK